MAKITSIKDLGPRGRTGRSLRRQWPCKGPSHRRSASRVLSGSPCRAGTCQAIRRCPVPRGLVVPVHPLPDHALHLVRPAVALDLLRGSRLHENGARERGQAGDPNRHLNATQCSEQRGYKRLECGQILENWDGQMGGTGWLCHWVSNSFFPED